MVFFFWREDGLDTSIDLPNGAISMHFLHKYIARAAKMCHSRASCCDLRPAVIFEALWIDVVQSVVLL